jgi:hypothetical protein
MKQRMKEKFLIDEKGHKQAVVIEIGRYQEMMEDIADLKVIAERKNNPKYSATSFVLKLKKHGIL